MTELTILMPCLNEAATVGSCIAKARGFLERAGIAGEVLVADNGSDDGSRALAEAAGARVVEVAEGGYGAALAGGIAAARGRYVIMGDADDSYDFARLEGFVARLREGYPLVMGNRFHGGIGKGAMPLLHRYLGNPVLSFVGRLLFDAPVGDFHCGLRGFDRDAGRTLDLRTRGMAFATVVLYFAPLHILGAGLDIHSMLYASAGALLGLQLCLFALFARVSAQNAGLLPRRPGLDRLLRTLTLERGLLLGLLAAVSGLLW